MAILTLLCAGGAGWLYLDPPMCYVQAEYQLRDLLARSGRLAPANPDLVFLAIDSDSVSLDESLDLDGLFSSATSEPECQRALQLMSKGWPWNREIYALILQRLANAGAKVVAFDCLFAGPAPGDEVLRSALERYRSQVVIGSNFVTPTNMAVSSTVPSSYEQPSESLLPKSAVPDDREGFTNFFTAEDKIVRAAQFRIAFREGSGPSSEPQLYSSLAARAASKAGLVSRVPDDLGEHVIRFTGPPRAGFRSHSLFEIFVPDYWQHNYQSGRFFQNKIVIVGAEGKWQTDELATPFGLMPGAELHLNAVNALWHREFLRELSPLAGTLVIVVAALIAAAICLCIRVPWLRVAGLVAVNVTGPPCALWLYNSQGLYFPCIPPALALNAAVLLCLVSDFTFERIEKIRLNSTLKTRDELTHMIIHDLRSPLTVVKGYVEALAYMASDKLTPDEAKCLNEAQRGADDLRDMISTLLDVNRLEAGQMPLRIQQNDLAKIARDAAARFTPILEGRILQCQGVEEPVSMACDADLVRRVLENLISNAIKFTRSDGGRIVVGVDQNGRGAVLSVTDNGEGIPVEQHKRIFEKFGQTEAGSKRQNSTGIGLAFCRLAVEAHGGKIGVRSAPGEGSTFWFSLASRESMISQRLPQSATKQPQELSV